MRIAAVEILPVSVLYRYAEVGSLVARDGGRERAGRDPEGVVCFKERSGLSPHGTRFPHRVDCCCYDHGLMKEKQAETT